MLNLKQVEEFKEAYLPRINSLKERAGENNFYQFVTKSLEERLEKVAFDSETITSLADRLESWMDDSPYHDESSLAKVFFSVYDSESASNTLEESALPFIKNKLRSRVLEDLSDFLFGRPIHKRYDDVFINTDLITRALIKAKDVIIPKLFQLYDIPEEHTFLRDYVRSLADENTYLGGPYAEWGGWRVADKLDKHLNHNYSNEESGKAKADYLQFFWNDVVPVFKKKFKNYIECIFLGGSLGREAKFGTQAGFDPHSDMDVIIFYNDNTPDSVVSEMLSLKRDLNKKLTTINPHYHLCSGGRIGVFGDESELWEYTSPSILKRLFNRDPNNLPLRFIYTNCKYGGIAYQKDGWFESNVAPLLADAAKSRLDKRYDNLRKLFS